MVFKYLEKKMVIFFNRNILIFFFSNFSTKTCCGYSSKEPQPGNSNEFPHVFLWRNKKNIIWIPTLYRPVHYGTSHICLLDLNVIWLYFEKKDQTPNFAQGFCFFQILPKSKIYLFSSTILVYHFQMSWLLPENTVITLNIGTAKPKQTVASHLGLHCLPLSRADFRHINMK